MANTLDPLDGLTGQEAICRVWSILRHVLCILPRSAQWTSQRRKGPGFRASALCGLDLPHFSTSRDRGCCSSSFSPPRAMRVTSTMTWGLQDEEHNISTLSNCRLESFTTNAPTSLVTRLRPGCLQVSRDRKTKFSIPSSTSIL